MLLWVTIEIIYVKNLNWCVAVFGTPKKWFTLEALCPKFCFLPWGGSSLIKDSNQLIHLFITEWLLVYYLQIKSLIFLTLHFSGEDQQIKKKWIIQMCRLLINAKKKKQVRVENEEQRYSFWQCSHRRLCADGISTETQIKKGNEPQHISERRVLWTVVKANVKALRSVVWGQQEDFWVRMELWEVECVEKWGVGSSWGRSFEPSRPW